MITVIPDISLVYQMINFLILLFVLNQLLYKPIRKILLERKAKIQGLESGVEKPMLIYLPRRNPTRMGCGKPEPRA